MTKRKSPIRHRVKTHTRNKKRVNSYVRGSGRLDVRARRRLVKKVHSPKKQFNSELQMGIKVEMEHTTDKRIAEKIARDHLKEFPDYYTRLARMEKEGKEALRKKEKELDTSKDAIKRRMKNYTDNQLRGILEFEGAPSRNMSKKDRKYFGTLIVEAKKETERRK